MLAALTLQADVGTTISLNMRVGISSGVITAGMLGPRNKSMYDVLGETVNVAQRMESSAPLGGIVVTAATADLVRPYFLLETLPEQEIKGLSKMTNFRVVGPRKLTDDPRRVDPSSRFAAMAPPLQEEIEAFKAVHFDRVNFLSIQARDGAFFHNETVAILALALLRDLRGHADLGRQAAQIDEPRLLRLALLHDIGKRAIEPRRLNLRGLAAEERAVLRTDLEHLTSETLERLELGELAAALPAFYRFEAQETTGDIDLLTEIVGVADIYDALTAPKFYKGTPWSIRGALEDLLRMPFAARPEATGLARFCGPNAPSERHVDGGPHQFRQARAGLNFALLLARRKQVAAASASLVMAQTGNSYRPLVAGKWALKSSAASPAPRSESRARIPAPNRSTPKSTVIRQIALPPGSCGRDGRSRC